MTSDKTPMPSLRCIGGYWTCLWYDQQGERHWARLGSVKKVSRSQAEDRYSEIFEAWRRGSLDAGVTPGRGATVAQFVDAYTKHARGYYIDSSGKPTGEATNMVDALGPLKDLYGPLSLERLRPPHITEVQRAMVAAGLARRTVNNRIRRIRRAIRWAVANDMAEPAVLQGIEAVEPLRRGRTTAREAEKVKPVAMKDVRAIMRHLSPTVRAMVSAQYHAGMRPQDVCNLRWVDIDRSGKPWLYAPFRHKTQWQDQARVVVIGPKAQRVLLRYKDVVARAFIFSPRRALAELYARRTTHRHQPSPEPKTDRRVSDFYTTGSYRQAIQDACAKAGIPVWAPNQLRHAMGTLVRARFGLDHAQEVLGHRKSETTEIYAPPTLDKATTAMQKLG